jgi:peptidylprolyl isomerase
MASVKEGDVVRIHYTGKLEDGTVFDSSEDSASLEIKLGQGEFLPGLEKGLIGMNIGESRTIRIGASEGYGLHQKERVFEFDRSKLPEDAKPEINNKMTLFRADGMPIEVTVVGMSETSLTLDCNHHLAGKNLVFDVTLEEIL